MAFALVVLALAMMAGGGYAAWTGYDIVQMERGWALLIAGSVVASGGAVLLGLAAAVGRLGRLRRELARPAPVKAARSEPSFPLAPSPVPPQAAADVPFQPGPSSAPPVDPAILQGAPEFLMRRRGAPRPSNGPAFPVLPPELERPVERRTGASQEPEENAPFAPGDPVVPDVQTRPAASSTFENDQPTGGPPTIVGTYNSGGNRYVMYSDGSIAADTPNGKFTFDSLDELKRFIANGGERG